MLARTVFGAEESNSMREDLPAEFPWGGLVDPEDVLILRPCNAG